MMTNQWTHQQTQLNLMKEVHTCIKTSTHVSNATLEDSFTFPWTEQICSSQTKPPEIPAWTAGPMRLVLTGQETCRVERIRLEV